MNIKNIENINFSMEVLIYGLPKGETERHTEALLSINCKNMEHVEKVIAAATADGFHSFRVVNFDPSIPPDFTGTVNLDELDDDDEYCEDEDNDYYPPNMSIMDLL